jgi:hypothetical protein
MTDLLKTDVECEGFVYHAVKERLYECDRNNQEANPRGGRSEIWIEDEIRALLEDDHPQTLRSLFYEAVAAELLQHSETEFEVLVRLLDDLRRNGRIPEGWILKPSRSTTNP